MTAYIPAKETVSEIGHFRNSQTRDHDMDWIIPSCITHRPLSAYQISLKSEKRTDIDISFGPLG